MSLRRTSLLLATLIFASVAAWQTYSQATVQLSSPTTQVTATAAIATSTAATSTRPLPQNTYPVARVIDGDTLIVDERGHDVTVRVIGLDTPEVVDPRKPPECFGLQASTEAKKLLTGTNVRLESDPSQDAKDKYGRTLAYVFLPDGQNFELSMIREGYGHEYTYKTAYKYQKEFKTAEASAKAAHLGLWSPSTCDGNTGVGSKPIQ